MVGAKAGLVEHQTQEVPELDLRASPQKRERVEVHKSSMLMLETVK